MLKSIDFDVSMIDRVYVAGGIGSGINMRNAVRIGMFPDIEDLFLQALIKNSSYFTKDTACVSFEADDTQAVMVQ